MTELHPWVEAEFETSAGMPAPRIAWATALIGSVAK